MPIARSLSTGLPGSAILQKLGCACGGGCPRCQEQAPLPTQLKISEPGDHYEQEADHIADQIMRMSAGEEELDELEAETIQTKSLANSLIASPPDQGEFSANSSSVEDVLNSSGEPLNPRTRNFMESRFGQDFSQVRIHADDRSATSAQSIHAQAYTAGKNIVFNTGLYQPETDSGKHLLAHELAHVVQQSGNQPLTMIQRRDWLL